MKHASIQRIGFVLLLLAVGVTGCDSLESINPFDNEKEVEGVIEALGADNLTVDAVVYMVTSDTEFGDRAGLADFSVGEEVEIDYEEDGDTRNAKEIELIE